MADERHEELEGRFFDGGASAEDEAALVASAEGSPDIRRSGARQLLVDRVLRQLGRPTLDPGPIMEAVRRQEPAFVDRVMRSLPPTASQRRRRAIAGAAGAFAMAAGVALWVARDRPERDTRTVNVVEPIEVPSPLVATPISPASPPAGQATFARVERTAGTARLLGSQAHPLPLQTGLLVGASLITVGSASSATLVRAEGTRLDLSGDVVLTALADDAALLARGLVWATAAGPLRLTTPHARVETSDRGARLRVEVGALSTRVEVNAGQVRVWPSSGGPIDVMAGRYALLLEGHDSQTGAQARSGYLVFIVGEEPLRPGDRALRGRLNHLGYEVRTILPGATGFEALSRDSRVVLVSSTVSSTDFIAPLREAAVPVVTWERSIFDDLGMTGPCDEGACGEANEMRAVLKDSTHPLAAGERGVVRLTDAGPLTWGTPGLQASWIATVSGHPDRAVVFAYERGVPMPGLVAPARRVGLFMGDWSASKMRDSGWRLFDAAVEWAAADGAR